MKLLWTINSAFAEVPGASSLKDGLSPFIPLVLMIGVFYFLIIRPQQKKMKTQQEFLKNLKKGDMVVTTAGIIGTIKNLSEKFIFLEVDTDVTLKILKGQIADAANNLKEEAKT